MSSMSPNNPSILMSVLFVLFFVAVVPALFAASAFSPSDYIYSTEKNATINYTNFTYDNVNYSLVSINNAKTFLLREGQLITDADQISSVLQSYYSLEYAPTQAEINNLREAIRNYNASRNDGQRWRGKEEEVCKSVIFIDGRVKVMGNTSVVCEDNSSAVTCDYASKLMFQYLMSISGVPPVGSPSALLTPIKDFGFSSHTTTVILDTAMQKLDTAGSDPGKLVEASNYVKTSIPALTAARSKLENSLFGWSKNGTIDSTHWGLCPDISLSKTALDNMSASASFLIAKATPFSNYALVSSTIHNNTEARLEYVRTEATAKQYIGVFSGINSTGKAAIALGEEAAQKVSDVAFSAKLDRLKSLHASIPAHIAARNFSTVDADLADYASLVESVNSNAVTLLEEYNKTRDAKNLAGSILLTLETKSFAPSTADSFAELKTKSADLDLEFRDGLTATQLDSLYANYTVVSDGAQALIKGEESLPAAKSILLFRSFARHVNGGIANFATATNVTAETEEGNQSVTFAGFSALVFLSLSSLALVSFLFFTVSFGFDLPKSKHIMCVGFVCSLILISVFCVFLYLLLDKTSNAATPSEFISDFQTKNSAVLLLDLREGAYADKEAMLSCAASLSDVFASQNKTWTQYSLTADGCNATSMFGDVGSGLTVDQCLDLADADSHSSSSTFVLGYSATPEPPKFSIIYKNEAEIKANSEYYESCPLVAIFN